MRYEGASRYQFQPWHVKLWRRVRHSPIFLHAAWTFAGWLVVHRLRIADHCSTRWETAAHAWQIWVSVYQVEMGWWHSMDEARERVSGPAPAEPKGEVK